MSAPQFVDGERTVICTVSRATGRIVSIPGQVWPPTEESSEMTHAVRAKFKVQSVTESEGGLKTASLRPVISGSPENAEFYKWTPSGGIELSTLNPAAAVHFVPGREFYVDFSPAS